MVKSHSLADNHPLATSRRVNGGSRNVVLAWANGDGEKERRRKFARAVNATWRAARCRGVRRRRHVLPNGAGARKAWGKAPCVRGRRPSRRRLRTVRFRSCRPGRIPRAWSGVRRSAAERAFPGRKLSKARTACRRSGRANSARPRKARTSPIPRERRGGGETAAASARATGQQLCRKEESRLIGLPEDAAKLGRRGCLRRNGPRFSPGERRESRQASSPASFRRAGRLCSRGPLRTEGRGLRPTRTPGAVVAGRPRQRVRGFRGGAHGGARRPTRVPNALARTARTVFERKGAWPPGRVPFLFPSSLSRTVPFRAPLPFGLRAPFASDSASLFVPDAAFGMPPAIFRASLHVPAYTRRCRGVGARRERRT